MEELVQELQLQLEKQCALNKELQSQNQDLVTRLEEKERFLTALQSRFDQLDNHPERSSNESEPEVRKSRAAVIAPEPLPVDLEITEARVKKTISETSLIVKAIQKNDFLSRIDDEQITMMVELLVSTDRSPGEVVITEGSEGDSMYIVADGELRVTQGGQDLRTLTSGDVFGELAILYNCKRTASVQDCHGGAAARSPPDQEPSLPSCPGKPADPPAMPTYLGEPPSATAPTPCPEAQQEAIVAPPSCPGESPGPAALLSWSDSVQEA
ncbi:hypothetical protein COCON_G00093910 [Conger conger]|uniref:Cyclic nucleotide-binding domain-containing protein n=1 Tax=Conger conger TaxID=82655 RepID=A0A9Q1DLS0_CONCO|nr:hypothetical protein COCON_G00093910 [Conger conger]